MTLAYLFFLSLLVWVAVGATWLLPKKLKLMKRVGNLTNDQLIQLAKAGDVEAQSLRRKGWWWLGIGLAVLLPQQLLLGILKRAGGG